MVVCGDGGGGGEDGGVSTLTNLTNQWYGV